MSVLNFERSPASLRFSDIVVDLEQMHLTEFRRRMVAKREGTAMETDHTGGM
jgi:hypothetical protein